MKNRAYKFILMGFPVILSMALLMPLSVQAYRQVALDTTLSWVDSESYPAINAYVSVIDRRVLVPVEGLEVDNFIVTLPTEDSAELTIQQIEEIRRPLHVVAVLDITASVSEEELTQQRFAVETLMTELQPTEGDKLALMTMSGEQAILLENLQSDFDVIQASLDNLTLEDEAGGNVFWDGVHGAVALLQDKSVRQAVIVITDTGADTASGSHTAEEAIALARQNQVQIYSLYFLFEDEGIPEGAPPLPPELLHLTETTGGVALGSPGDIKSHRDYTDEMSLWVLIQVVYELLNHEYQLTMNATLPPDGQLHDFELAVHYEGSADESVSGQFTAGLSPLMVTFPGIDEELSVTLPYPLQPRIESTAGDIRSVTFYAVNETGQEILLDTIEVESGSSASPGLDIEPDMLDSGAFRIRVVAEDTTGNQSEASIMLKITGSLSVDLIEDPPDSINSGETLTLHTRIGLPEQVGAVMLLVNEKTVATISGDELELLPDGTAGEATLTWKPDKGGDYNLTIEVNDRSGRVVQKTFSLVVNEAGGDEKSGGISLYVILLLAGGGVALVSGLLLGRWRRQKARGAPVMQPVSALPSEEDEHEKSDEFQAIPAPMLSPIASPIASPLPESAFNSPTMQGQQIQMEAMKGVLYGAGDVCHELIDGENCLGRHGSNNIQILEDETVSRYHARIDVTPEGCFYADWQAKSPTEINGVLLMPDERYPLRDGDVLRVGSTLLRFALEEIKPTQPDEK